MIATLAISGFPFFSGFYSKDNIIGLAFKQGDYGLYVITLGTAGLTAFYMLRAYILAFGGKGGGYGGLWGGTYRGEGHPHEAPRTITIPLVLLAIASVIAGYWTGFFSYVQPGAPPLNIGEVLSGLAGHGVPYLEGPLPLLGYFAAAHGCQFDRWLPQPVIKLLQGTPQARQVSLAQRSLTHTCASLLIEECFNGDAFRGSLVKQRR